MRCFATPQNVISKKKVERKKKMFAYSTSFLSPSKAIFSARCKMSSENASNLDKSAFFTRIRKADVSGYERITLRGRAKHEFTGLKIKKNN